MARTASLSFAVSTGLQPSLGPGRRGLLYGDRSVRGGSAPHAEAPPDPSKSGRFAAWPAHREAFAAPIGAHLCSTGAAAAEMAGAKRKATAALAALSSSASSPSLHGGSGHHGAFLGHFHGVGGSTTGGGGAAAAALSLAGGSYHHGGHTHHGGASQHGPSGREHILAGLGRPVLELLEAQSAVEEFLENRFLSAERLLAFLVSFHAMAATVASFWPLQWDTSRSQSRLRVATTAAPVSAADLQTSFAAGTAAGLDESMHAGMGAGVSLAGDAEAAAAGAIAGSAPAPASSPTDEPAPTGAAVAARFGLGVLHPFVPSRAARTHGSDRLGGGGGAAAAAVREEAAAEAEADASMGVPWWAEPA